MYPPVEAPAPTAAPKSPVVVDDVPKSGVSASWRRSISACWAKDFSGLLERVEDKRRSVKNVDECKVFMLFFFGWLIFFYFFR